MITLTSPRSIQATLGSAAVTNYDKFILSQITYDVVLKTVSGLVRLTASATPTAQPITGRFNIDRDGVLTLEIEQTDIYHRRVLTAGEKTAVDGYITAAQNSLEQGMAGLAVVVGTQTTGI